MYDFLLYVHLYSPKRVAIIQLQQNKQTAGLNKLQLYINGEIKIYIYTTHEMKISNVSLQYNSHLAMA